MERVFDERIMIICKSCDHPMTLESMNGDKCFIYLCELCKHEVKVISIGNQRVS